MDFKFKSHKLPVRNTGSLTQTIKNKNDLDFIPEIRKAIDTAEKILSDKGRVLVSYSGTQSLCRVMVEGPDEKKIKGIAQNLVQLIGNKLN